MRVVIHNPHTNIHFGNTVLGYIIGTKGYRKYRYILDYLLKKNGKLYFYLDNKDSSLPKPFSKFFPARIELLLWALINKVSLKSIIILPRTRNIRNEDIFFSFSLRYLDQDYHGLDDLIAHKCLKVFHLTHFVQNTKIISQQAKRLKIDYFIAENDLSKNSLFFRTYFPWYKNDFITLPFIFQERFKNSKLFENRKNKCLATGTIVDINETHEPKEFNTFKDFFKTTTLQPLRKEIFDKKESLGETIDCRISVLYEHKLRVTKNKNPFIRVFDKVNNAFRSTKRSYFDFDIVKEYNNYKMFINGEEINDLPGIGFVEGMACGSAYLGKIDPMYRDLGFIPGIHYIGHDGTLTDVQKKIKMYQRRPEQLKKIAEAGHRLIRDKFNSKVVAKKFIDDLEKIALKTKDFRINLLLDSKAYEKTDHFV